MAMFKDAKIYVAGHKGLLGTALVKRLKADGYQNIITRTHRELDLTNQDAVDSFFKQERPEYVFLAAGVTGGILANKTYPAVFLQTNIAIQNNAFQSARKYEVKYLIFYGSSCMYPKNCPQPIKEEHLLTGEIEKTSEAYAIAKISGIVACKSYNSQLKTNRFIALIPNSMYGPGDNFDSDKSHVLSALIRKFSDSKTDGKEKITLWGSGNPRREFIFSEDVAGASVFAMNNAERLQNMHYNLGTGIDYSIKEVSGIISKIVGFEGEIEWDTTKPDGTPRKLLDSKKFNQLGWKSQTGLDEGLFKTYEWFLENEKYSWGVR